MDRLTQMELFTQVATLESFSGAARRMRLSNGAVSKGVAALEERLGVRLLNRTTRRLSLTDAGRAYLEQCRRILAEVAEAEASVSSMWTEPRGPLRLNAPMSFGVLHLARQVADFLTLYPEITIEMAMTDRKVNVVDEGFDMVVRIGQLRDSSLIARKLAPARLVVCASPDYVARYGEPQVPADLSTCPTLLYTNVNPADVWHFQGPDGEVTVKVNGRLWVNNGDAIREAALQGVGLAIMPTFIVGKDLQAGRLISLLPEYRLPELGVYALYPHNRHLSAKVRILVDFLKKRFGPNPYWDLVG
ncbi:MAG: LysR family transcriptional regulator [Magnetococcales bacterium]|nr:LysR family transcriptional regulator [Magnetococcales bacterium]